VTRLGIFVGENNWTFFNEIYEDLSNKYATEVFKRETYNVPLLYGRLNRWAFSRNIRLLLKNNDICFFEWAGELLSFASHLPKTCKIVTRLHSFELYEWAPKINWDNVDKVILVSKAMQQMFADLYPQHSSKTEVIYNGRPLDLFYPSEQRNQSLKIGMLGHISPIKRVYEAILMFNSIIRQGYDFHFHIAGDPADDYRYSVAIHRLVEMLKLQEYVVFDGHQHDASAWLRNIDIFISNSYWEGQQVALLEAMASGCFCISHIWAGADEMLPQNHLFTTEDELALKVIEYFKMSEENRIRDRTIMRNLALEKFNIELTKKKIQQVIEELM
jgi:glycosyltransferase involved in cell wall biosynthesis